ncbi:MAG: nuclear transport factor 2 family protein [Hyphomicrobiales bacterium]|nr:nuclear transport factor 2 family protein [Hyphomicrobiales bacterium]
MQKLLRGAALACALTLGVASSMAAECIDAISADEALKGEDARYAALTNDDFAGMERLFGDELLYTHSSGRSDTKASFIELLRSKSLVYRSMQRSNVNVRTYGCVAIITGSGHFEVTTNGKDATVDLLFHSIWVKRGGRAQFISWESTLAPKP